MTKFGQVTAYDTVRRTATIEYARPEACEKCGGCGSASHKGAIALQADCQVGDWVRVELPEGRFLKATAWAYLLPLAGLLLGLFTGQRLGGGEGFALLGAALGLALSFGLLWLYDRSIRGRKEWLPRVTEVYPEKPSLETIGCSGQG